MSAFEDILNEQDDEEIEAPEADTSTATAGDDLEAVAESPALEETSTEAPAPVAEEAQPAITRDDGAKWSEKAQRWYKDGVIVAGGKPDTTPEPSNPSTPQAPVVEPVAEVPPPAPVAEPWTLRAAGQKLTVPGASIVDGKLVVEGPENIARHRDIVAAGIQHLQNYGREKQQWTQQIKDAEQRGKAEGQKYNQAAILLWDHIMNAEWLWNAAQNPEHVGILRDKLDVALQRASLAIPQQPAPQEQEVTPEVFTSALTSALDELIEDVPKGLLTAEDIAELKATYARRMNAYAAEHEGEIVLDFHAVRDDFQRDLKMYTRAQAAAQKAAEDAKKAKAAAAFNAANTPKTPAPTPSRPAPKPALAAAPSGTKPSWDQSFKSAFADDDE